MDDRPDLPTVARASYQCAGCGYDLSGSAIGGVCPECGASVSESIRFANAKRNGASGSGSAVLCLILGIVGVTACGLVAPIAIWLYYTTKAEIARGETEPSAIGMATAGMVLGWIGTGLILLGCTFWMLAVGLSIV